MNPGDIMTMIGSGGSLWERRKSRRAMMMPDCSRDLRRSHKTPDIGSTACA